MTKQEIITAALSADINGNGSIDFEEFMKHFKDILDMTHFHQQLQTKLEEHERQLADEKRAEAILAGLSNEKDNKAGGGVNASAFHAIQSTMEATASHV